jgi:hypothetical protein
MTGPARTLSIGGAAVAMFLGASLASAPAQAQPGWWRYHGRGYYYARPVPQPYAYGPAYGPPVVEERRLEPQLGLEVGGVVQSAPDGGGSALSGMSAALQLRTSPFSQLALEVQSLGSERDFDRARRDDLDGLLSGRVYPWRGPLAPYLEIAAGAGRSSFQFDGLERSSSHLVGRIGIGLELRLGHHLAFNAALASVHRLRLDDEPARYGDLCCVDATDDHERATELRGGIAFRF